jgi:hypothetical protein
MCMNCGCGQPHEDHGKPGNITAEDLVRAAEANGQSLRESAQHIVETVQLIDASRRDDRGLAEAGASRSSASAGSTGSAAPGGSGDGRGTPASES